MANIVPNFTGGVWRQTDWRQVGDIDDCWVLADLRCVNAVAGWANLPGTTAYRKAAGDPDDGVSDGGTIAESTLALRTLYPDLAISPVRAGSFPDFIAAVKSGRCASLSILSGAMPVDQRYGFARGHRISLYWNGTIFRSVNPLGKRFAIGDPITVAELKKAVDGYDSKGVWAVLFPTVNDAFKTHPLYVEPAPVDVAAAVLQGKQEQYDLDKASAKATTVTTIDIGPRP